jgi:hypothetical protein
MVPSLTVTALRPIKDVKAYENDPSIGSDPQTKYLKDKYTGTQDYSGVNINSGIPNHAFLQDCHGNGRQRAGMLQSASGRRLLQSVCMPKAIAKMLPTWFFRRLLILVPGRETMFAMAGTMQGYRA